MRLNCLAWLTTPVSVIYSNLATLGMETACKAEKTVDVQGSQSCPPDARCLINHEYQNQQNVLFCCKTPKMFISIPCDVSVHLEFSNTLSLHSSLNVSDQVAHSYKTRGIIIFLYILILVYLDSNPDDKRFCIK
jgi:hypothetical protein